MPRRSPCPISCSLDLFGDRWTLLIVRDLILNRSRFKEFAASPEAIPTNILSERLRRLVAAKVVQRVRLPGGGKHLGYRLTAKGRALRPVLGTMKDWALRWEKGTRMLRSPGTSPASLPPKPRKG